MAITLQSDGGRYPYQLAPYKPAEIRASLQVEGELVRIRIDDLRNSDRWEELVVEYRQLLSELMQREAERETTVDPTDK